MTHEEIWEIIEFCNENRCLEDFEELNIDNIYYKLCKLLITKELYVHNDCTISRDSYDPDEDIVDYD